jgi:hypothetical protein
MRGTPQMSVFQQPARDSLAQDSLRRISGMIFGKPKRSLPWEKRSGGIEIGYMKNNTRHDHFQSQHTKGVVGKLLNRETGS